MARALEVDWRESERELYELYRREANPHRRTRLQALWLLRQRKSIKEVAPVVGMHYRTVQTWVAWAKFCAGHQATQLGVRQPLLFSTFWRNYCNASAIWLTCRR